VTALHWSEWPARDKKLDPDGHVYVLEFSMDVIKVGRTNNPRGRVRQHESDALRFGGHLTRWWLSPSHRGYYASEAALIAAAHKEGTLLGGAEYFTGCSFEAMVAVASALPMTPSMPIEREADRERSARALEKVKGFFGNPELEPAEGSLLRVDDCAAAFVSLLLSPGTPLPKPVAPVPTAEILESADVLARAYGIDAIQALDMSYLDIAEEGLVRIVRLLGRLLRTKARVAGRYDLLASGHEQIANNEPSRDLVAIKGGVA